MTSTRKDQIRALLKGIETGDPESVKVVNEDKYIQHNPQTHEGSEGLAALFKRLSLTSPKVNVVRAFEDGDFVFAHTEYDFASRHIGFEIFRFEQGQAVEHWDNIQPRKGPNPSGHSMVGGVTEASEFKHTESNRILVQTFVNQVLIERDASALETYIKPGQFTEHNPQLSDDLTGLRSLIEQAAQHPNPIAYRTCHRLLAEGDFVLSVCEGMSNHQPTSFFDLYRIADRHIVEHWDTTETMAPQSQWKNNNGKFNGL